MLPGLTELETLARHEGTRFTPFSTSTRLLNLLGNPQDRVPSVHVAGTNGKGSVCALLASMLRAHGLNVGHFASPHLTAITERCLINGRPVSARDFDVVVSEVLELARKEEAELSYFVICALASFLQFARQELDFSVIEVGLGGALDATNALTRPAATAVTNIALDHTHILGDTLQEIAENKAGIFKAGSPAFVGRVPTALRQLFRTRAAALGTTVEILGEDFLFDDKNGVLECKAGVVSLPENHLFAAPYQRENVALAARIALALGLSENEIAEGISRARWPGRVERITTTPPGASSSVELLLDAAHNPNGMEALLHHLSRIRAERGSRGFVFLLSILNRKNWEDMLLHLREFIDATVHEHNLPCTVIGTRMDHPNALEPESFTSFIPEAKVIEPLSEALQAALSEGSDGKLVVATGSIYLLGQLRPGLTDSPFCTIEER